MNISHPTSPELLENPGSAYRWLKVPFKQAMLPGIRFRSLRCTFASHAPTSGMGTKALYGILGNTNASFTLDTYIHTTAMQQTVVEKVGLHCARGVR